MVVWWCQYVVDIRGVKWYCIHGGINANMLMFYCHFPLSSMYHDSMNNSLVRDFLLERVERANPTWLDQEDIEDLALGRKRTTQPCPSQELNTYYLMLFRPLASIYLFLFGCSELIPPIECSCHKQTIRVIDFECWSLTIFFTAMSGREAYAVCLMAISHRHQAATFSSKWPTSFHHWGLVAMCLPGSIYDRLTHCPRFHQFTRWSSEAPKLGSSKLGYGFGLWVITNYPLVI